MKNILTTLIMLGVLYLTMIFVQSCAKYYTLPQAQKLLNADVNDVGKAKAQVVLQTGLKEAEIKAANLKQQYNDQRVLFWIMLIAIASLFVLAYFKLTYFSFLSISVIAACAAGIGLLQLDIHYPKAVPLVGGFGTVLFGGAAAYFAISKMKIFGSFKEVVKNVEKLKPAIYNTYAGSKEDAKAILSEQSDFTKKLVAKAKAKL